jgi:preprotein translocase subunit SecE
LVNSRIEQAKGAAPAGDIVKYALAILLVAAGVFAFYWFANQWMGLVRGLAVVGGLVLGGLVFMATAKGREAREFLSESRFELRKVVWPARKDAMRTTWVVIGVVVLVSLVLAGFDVVIQWAVKLVLGR